MNVFNQYRCWAHLRPNRASGKSGHVRHAKIGTNFPLAAPRPVRREPDKHWRDFLSVWVDYNRGIGQMREWFVKGLALSGVKPEDVPVELSI
jgi:hypothetical protein